MTNVAQLDDQSFLNQFEEMCLDSVHFDHIGHLRIAWIYLNQSCSLESVDKICHGINRYATHLGSNDKYHHTLSYTLALIIAQRMLNNPATCWANFLSANQDLKSNALAVVQQYFSFDLFTHPTAKTQLIKSDVISLNYQ